MSRSRAWQLRSFLDLGLESDLDNLWFSLSRGNYGPPLLLFRTCKGATLLNLAFRWRLATLQIIASYPLVWKSPPKSPSHIYLPWEDFPPIRTHAPLLVESWEEYQELLTKSVDRPTPTLHDVLSQSYTSKLSYSSLPVSSPLHSVPAWLHWNTRWLKKRGPWLGCANFKPTLRKIGLRRWDAIKL